jgi:hypothetical protein
MPELKYFSYIATGDGWNVLHFIFNAKATTSEIFPCLKIVLDKADQAMWKQEGITYGAGSIWGGGLFPQDSQGTKHTALEFFDAFASQHPGEGYDALLETAHALAEIPLAGAGGAGAAASSLYD